MFSLVSIRHYFGKAFFCSVLMGSLGLAACSRSADQLVASGKTYLDQGKYNEAILELKNAVNKNPQLAEAHYQLGLAYVATGQMANVRQEFGRAASLQCTHVRAELKNVNRLLLDRKFDDERTAAQGILNREPQNVRAQILMGNSYSGIVQINGSIEELKTMFEREPRLIPSYVSLVE